jgi:hypothetical protein
MDIPSMKVLVFTTDSSQTLRVDAQHQRIRRQQARASTEHHPPPGMVVQLYDAVRRHQRIMVWQRNHAGAEADRFGAFRGDGDKQFGGTDQLPPRGVMLANPGFVETEAIEPLHQLQVPVHAGGGILIHWMKRGQEGPMAQRDAGHTG